MAWFGIIPADRPAPPARGRAAAERRARCAAMLRTLRRWIGRVVAATPSPTPEQARGAAADARRDRAAVVDGLRADVRRLQQEIKDASDALGGVAGAERAAQERRLAALHDDLARTQQELGRYQARV